MNYREVSDRLVALGCNELHGGRARSHRKWFNPATEKAAVIPNVSLKPETVRRAVQQLGLDWQAFADAFRSSTTQAVGMLRRNDLVVNEQSYQGKAWFVVKDPISLHFFRFRPEEYAILEMLDGQASLDEIKERFEARFPPRRITVEELTRFVVTLRRSGLVTSDGSGSGPRLFERRRHSTWRQWTGWLSNTISMKFRRISPD